MLLKQLKDLIHSELTIIDHTNFVSYGKVWCYGDLFSRLEEFKVIGVRAEKDCVVVSITEA